MFWITGEFYGIVHRFILIGFSVLCMGYLDLTAIHNLNQRNRFLLLP